ncbi:hypothetical protein SDC9_147558 [bioreactor metagenome]|uniref:Uncharacterized protein n=1 Tax=bioreactor metagenome TaxID=1076179 RepID=A0A645EHY9_9ZZZZ
MFLVFLHCLDVFFQRDELVFGRAVIEHEVGEEIFIHAVVAVEAVFDRQLKALIEQLILLAVVVHEFFELGLDPLLECDCDGF